MSSFIDKITNPFYYRMFLLRKLPVAWLCGLKVEELSDERATVSIKYGYWTKNPFQSIYFACLCMAAEMSNGIMAFAHVLNQEKPCALIVVGLECEFIKKARGTIRFTCDEGNKLRDTVEQAMSDGPEGEGRQVRIHSEGFDEEGDCVARFTITWSFKAKA
jgi:acyl-coenzyme A thioesterase PaaI-like protein